MDLQKEYFDDNKLGNVSLKQVPPVESAFADTDPNEWVFVRARTATRDAPLYSEGIYRVLKTLSAPPLVDEGVESLTENEVLERMPDGPESRMAVPSIKGEYLTVKEIKPDETEDGHVYPETYGKTTVIPVEYVIETMNYDEVMVELIDETL